MGTLLLCYNPNTLKKNFCVGSGVVAHMCNSSTSEAEAEDHLEFKASLNYALRPWLKNQGFFCVSVGIGSYLVALVLKFFVLRQGIELMTLLFSLPKPGITDM